MTKKEQQPIDQYTEEQRNARQRGLIAAPGESILVHSLTGSKRYLNDIVLIVKHYDKRRQRYILRLGGKNGEDIGSFKACNMRVIDEKEHHWARKVKMAALYDPTGPHPLKIEEDGSPLFPLLKALCPNVDHYKVSDMCNTCHKMPAQLAPGEQMSFCGRCKMASFCSKGCQRKSWPTHKETCTTRKQRIESLGSKLGSSLLGQQPEALERCRSLEVLETALDIAEEFVDGAMVVIVTCQFQVSDDSIILEEKMLNCVKQLCGIQLKKGDMSRLAEAMGVAEEMEISRKRWLAIFQKIEFDMNVPRAVAVNLWQVLCPMLEVEKDILSGIDGGVHIARGAGAPHTSILDVCKFVAERCENARLDKGSAIKDFLLLMSEILRYVVPPNKQEVDSKLRSAWEEFIRVSHGEPFLLEFGENTEFVVRCQMLHEMLFMSLERPHFHELDQSHVEKWLAAEKGRWLPHDYVMGTTRENVRRYTIHR